MRILRAKVQNYRIHDESEVAFHSDLTVLHGPNESGKSTLVEAMHRALFLSHKVGGKVLETMVRHPKGGQPEVELEFMVEGKRWVLWKRFGGGSAGVATLKDPDGRILSGTEAEDRLARLVGTDPVSSGGGATKALQERWGHLWVWQGTAGEDLLSRPAGPDAYEHGKLVARLQEVGEVSVQSALDQEVVAGIEARWSKVFTPTGQVRAGSLLKSAREEQAAAKEERDKIEARLKELEDAQRRHREATGRLGEARKALPREEARLQELEARLEQARELQRDRKQEVDLLEPKRADLQRMASDAEALQAARATQEKLAEALGPGQKALEALRGRQEEALGHRTRLRQERTVQEKALAELRDAVQAAENRSTQARLTLEVQRLARAAEAEEKLRRDVAMLEERLVSLPAIGEGDVQGLRDLARTSDLAQAELRSLAAEVRAVRAGIRVEVDGAELPEGEIRQITELSRLTVGDSVELELRPGGGGTAQEVRDRVTEAEVRLAREMERLGVSNVAEAEDAQRQRQTLIQERAERVAGSNLGRGEESSEDAVRQLAEAREELRYLEKDAHLEPLAGVDAARVAQVTEEEVELRTRLEKSQADLSRIRSSLDAAQGALDQLGDEIQRASDALKSQESEKASAENRIQLIRETYGSGEALQRALTTVHQEVKARTERIKEKDAALAGLDVDALEASRGQTQNLIGQLRNAEAEARSERDQLRGGLEQVAGLDLDAQLEGCQVRLEARSAEVDRFELEAEMLSLLRDLLEEEQNRLASRFSAPLQQAMEAYLACMVPDTSTSAIGYEAGRGFHTLQWRRGDGVAWDFEVLSGGAKEQLMAALRLAMAEVLAGVGEGAGGGQDRPGLPVVFDDSFVNADPQRMEGINRMLQRAAERGLQVLVFTCDPAGVKALGEGRMVAIGATR